MLFECPVCKQRHSVQDKYDNSDFICPNESTLNQKVFQMMVPDDLLTRSGFAMNRSSTKVNEARPATIINIKPGFRPTGEKIGQLKKNY